MLIDFSFKNYRCFRDEQVLSLVASKNREYKHSLIEPDENQDLKLLPSVVIYGANASGKSSVLDAIKFCLEFIRLSAKYEPNKSIPVQPYKLDNKSQSLPSEFEFMFIHDKVRYQYGFVVTRRRVLQEWLISYPKKKARNLFKRIYQEDTDSYSYSFSVYLQGEKGKLTQVTRSNTLFLSIGATFNNEQLMDVFNWFKNMIYGTEARNISHLMFFDLMDKMEYVNTIRKLIKHADFGISDISFNKQEFSELVSDLYEQTPEEIRDPLEKFFDTAVSLARKQRGDDLPIYEINVLHSQEDKSVPFSLEEESAGTRQYFTLSFPIVRALNNGSVLFIDELDSSLHPLLVRSIVNLFHDPKINNMGAQLVFNTHDTTLLNLSLFRRDQIWFVEKDQDGASDIYSLLEYSPRKDKALEKGYLQGRYGAIPFLGDLPKDVFNHG